MGKDAKDGAEALHADLWLWGVPVAILWSVAMSAMQGWDRLPLLLVIALIGFPIGGIFFGKVMWRILEGRYEATPQPGKGQMRK